MEESGGLESMGSQRVRHDLATKQQQGKGVAVEADIQHSSLKQIQNYKNHLLPLIGTVTIGFCFWWLFEHFIDKDPPGNSRLIKILKLIKVCLLYYIKSYVCDNYIYIYIYIYIYTCSFHLENIEN